MRNEKIRIGYYAHYPTILEPSPGAWGGMSIHEEHPVDAREKILKWLKSYEVDYVVAVISPKFRDNIMHDWPFHYVCDFKKYPEARVFPQELVVRHRDLTNRVVEIAGQIGIDMYFTHFNFYAPRGFVESHRRIYDKYRYTRGSGPAGHDSSNYMNTLLGNICWSDPEYQQFMKDCWTEFFQVIPKAKGLMITPGEYNHCECPKCKGTSLDKEAMKNSRMKMRIDFVHTFSKEMDRLGRDSFVRTWNLRSAPETFPKATAILSKYHVFDCFDAPIDPAAELEMTSGRPTHLMFVQNGENASQVFWFRPQYWQRIGKTLAEKKAQGAIIFENIDWGMNGMTHPAVSLNLEAFFHYVRNPDGGNDLWQKRAEEIFGVSVGKEILNALDLLSEFTMNVTKIIFLGSEGYTFGPIQPCDEEFAPDPWGVLTRNWQPPDWARGDIGRLRDYWDYLDKSAFDSFEDLKKKVLPKGERCPLEVMDRIIESAKEAIRILENLRDKADAKSRGFLDSLISGAHITQEHSTMLLKSMHTALLMHAARSPLNSKQTVSLGKKALETHTEALDALKRQIGWMNALPHDTLDFRNWFRFRMTSYTNYQAIQFTPLSLMEEENKNMRQWLMNLDPSIKDDSLPKSSMPSLTATKLPAMREKGWKKE